MSNQYIVKFVRDVNNSDSTTRDGFLELISDKGCPTIFIRTCKESTDPKNENLFPETAPAVMEERHACLKAFPSGCRAPQLTPFWQTPRSCRRG